MVMNDGSVKPFISWEVHSCILFERAARGSRFSNMADILTEVNAFIQHGRFDLLLENSW